MNLDTETFGPDAEMFNPARYLSGGVPPHYTFGGGPRHCIGWRLAIAEIKTAVFALVRRLEIADTAVPTRLSRFGWLGFARPKADGQLFMPVVLRPVSAEGLAR
ncbi:hypothetical protein Q5752_001422 [Cryptotrichosporon argae]